MKENVLAIIDEEIRLGNEFLEDLQEAFEEYDNIEDLHAIGKVECAVETLQELRIRMEDEL